MGTEWRKGKMGDWTVKNGTGGWERGGEGGAVSGGGYGIGRNPEFLVIK